MSKKHFNRKEINWLSCHREMISADRTDLPASIKAFKADCMNAATVKRAMELCRPPVQVVQIEIPFSEAGKATARLFAECLNPSFSSVAEPEAAEISLRHKMKSVDMQGVTDAEANDFVRRYGDMLRSVRQNRGIVTLATILGDGALGRVFYFHAHVEDNELPSWYLTMPADIEATIFVDAKDLAKRSFRGFSTEPLFNTRNPILWQGLSCSCFLFTAGNQPQGNAFHSMPPSDRKRATTALQFHL